ncbi:hypothetical protein TrST_g476 [Triparma strigata]|uniref:C3H1-type domain-containing protein n=1 Tax=Triparma strigata TaxID=1606541 RepID=A0A9W7EY55_9STRA|nr:hypothetical protein TrST_g476 [Triparma strigata]
MVRRTTWEVQPGETGFEYLERLVGQTELQVELKDFMVRKNNEEANNNRIISASDFEIGLSDTINPDNGKCTKITLVMQFQDQITESGQHVTLQVIIENEILHNQHFFEEKLNAPDVTPDADADGPTSEMSDFAKQVTTKKMSLKVDFRTGEKLGITVIDYLLKDALGHFTIPVLVATDLTQGMVPRALEEDYDGDLLFLDSEDKKVRVLIAFDDTLVTSKATVAAAKDGKGVCKVHFGKRFEAEDGVNAIKNKPAKKKKKEKETKEKTSASKPPSVVRVERAPTPPVEEMLPPPVKENPKRSKIPTPRTKIPTPRAPAPEPAPEPAPAPTRTSAPAEIPRKRKTAKTTATTKATTASSSSSSSSSSSLPEKATDTTATKKTTSTNAYPQKGSPLSAISKKCLLQKFDTYHVSINPTTKELYEKTYSRVKLVKSSDVFKILSVTGTSIHLRRVLPLPTLGRPDVVLQTNLHPWLIADEIEEVELEFNGPSWRKEKLGITFQKTEIDKSKDGRLLSIEDSCCRDVKTGRIAQFESLCLLKGKSPEDYAKIKAIGYGVGTLSPLESPENINELAEAHQGAKGEGHILKIRFIFYPRQEGTNSNSSKSTNNFNAKVVKEAKRKAEEAKRKAAMAKQETRKIDLERERSLKRSRPSDPPVWKPQPAVSLTRRQEYFFGRIQEMLEQRYPNRNLRICFVGKQYDKFYGYGGEYLRDIAFTGADPNLAKPKLKEVLKVGARAGYFEIGETKPNEVSIWISPGASATKRQRSLSTSKDDNMDMDMSPLHSLQLSVPSPPRIPSPLPYTKRTFIGAAPKILRNQASSAASVRTETRWDKKEKNKISFINDVATDCLVIDAIWDPNSLPDDGLNILAEGKFDPTKDAYAIKFAPGIENGPMYEMRNAKGKRALQMETYRRNMDSHVFSDEPYILNTLCSGISGYGCKASSSHNRSKCINCRLCRKCCGGGEGQEENMCAFTPAGAFQDKFHMDPVKLFGRDGRQKKKQKHAEQKKISLRLGLLDSVISRAFEEKIDPDFFARQQGVPVDVCIPDSMCDGSCNPYKEVNGWCEECEIPSPDAQEEFNQKMFRRVDETKKRLVADFEPALGLLKYLTNENGEPNEEATRVVNFGKNGTGETLLHAAAFHGKVDIVKELVIKWNADSNKSTDYQGSQTNKKALDFARQSSESESHQEVVQFLEKIELFEETMSALFGASLHDNEDNIVNIFEEVVNVIISLVREGYFPITHCRTGGDGETLLHAICICELPKALGTIIDEFYDVETNMFEIKDKKGFTPLTRAGDAFKKLVQQKIEAHERTRAREKEQEKAKAKKLLEAEIQHQQLSSPTRSRESSVSRLSPTSHFSSNSASSSYIRSTTKCRDTLMPCKRPRCGFVHSFSSKTRGLEPIDAPFTAKPRLNYYTIQGFKETHFDELSPAFRFKVRRNPNDDALNKIVECRDFAQGGCPKGYGCNYAHVAKLPQTDVSSPSICAHPLCFGDNRIIETDLARFYSTVHGLLINADPQHSVLFQEKHFYKDGAIRYSGCFICPLSGVCYFSGSGGPNGIGAPCEAYLADGYFWHVDKFCAAKSAMWVALKMLERNGVPQPHIHAGATPTGAGGRQIFEGLFRVCGGDSVSPAPMERQQKRTSIYEGKGGQDFMHKLRELVKGREKSTNPVMQGNVSKLWMEKYGKPALSSYCGAGEKLPEFLRTLDREGWIQVTKMSAPNTYKLSIPVPTNRII